MDRRRGHAGALGDPRRRAGALASEDRTHLLASCYRNALAIADQLGAGSVAFPAVSAGIYGWPIDDAADVAVRTVSATPTAVADVRFVLFSDEVLTQFRRAHDALA